MVLFLQGWTLSEWERIQLYKGIKRQSLGYCSALFDKTRERESLPCRSIIQNLGVLCLG
jgi:hypothetical protein